MLINQSGNRPVRHHALHRSSANKPCPACGRRRDGDCRWRDDWISCHTGAAANNLKPGDTLQINGALWYLSATGGGHSGASHIYRPHVHRPCSPSAQGRYIRKQLAMRPTLQQLFCKCRHAVQVCLAMPALEGLTPAQLTAELGHTLATLNNLAALREPLLQARREAPELTRQLRAVELWHKQCSFQLEGLERFLQVELGTPSARDLAALEAAR